MITFTIRPTKVTKASRFRYIPPDYIIFENPYFNSTLESITSEVKAELGFENDSRNVEAKLQKLVLYEHGHSPEMKLNDEKASGSFATIYIQLPSHFNGSNLKIYHGEQQSKFVNFDKTEAKYEIIYAAHYNECKHEIQPLKSGYRSVLVYNLVWKCQDAPLPSLQGNKERIEKLASILNKVSFFAFDSLFSNPFSFSSS